MTINMPQKHILQALQWVNDSYNMPGQQLSKKFLCKIVELTFMIGTRIGTAKRVN